MKPSVRHTYYFECTMCLGLLCTSLYSKYVINRLSLRGPNPQICNYLYLHKTQNWRPTPLKMAEKRTLQLQRLVDLNLVKIFIPTKKKG